MILKKKVSFNDSLLQVHLIPNLERYAQCSNMQLANSSQIDTNVGMSSSLSSPANFFLSDNDTDTDDLNSQFPPPPPLIHSSSMSHTPPLPPPPPPHTDSNRTTSSSNHHLDDSLPPPPSPNASLGSLNPYSMLGGDFLMHNPVINGLDGISIGGGGGHHHGGGGGGGSRSNTPMKLAASGHTTTATIVGANNRNTPTSLNHFTNSFETQQQPHFKVN